SRAAFTIVQACPGSAAQRFALRRARDTRPGARPLAPEHLADAGGKRVDRERLRHHRHAGRQKAARKRGVLGVAGDEQEFQLGPPPAATAASPSSDNRSSTSSRTAASSSMTRTVLPPAPLNSPLTRPSPSARTDLSPARGAMLKNCLPGPEFNGLSLARPGDP